MADNSNKPKFTKLTPEDIEFYELINSNITSGNALPFDIPVDEFFRIVIRSTKWLWEWYAAATQEAMLFIPNQEIIRVGKSVSGNIDVKLPNGIEGIIEVAQTNSGPQGKVLDHLKIPLLTSYNSTYRSSGGQNFGAGFRSGYGVGTHKISDVVISMYEFSMYRTLFNRGIRHSFNKNTQIFRLMTGLQGSGIVLNVFQRLEPRMLYGDYVFEEYVTARVEEQLGRIVTAFNFQLPGSITLNYDQIRENGIEKRKELESEIKESNNNDFLMSY